MRQQGDDGFGMVEVIVSMFLLGLLAISFLPLLIQGLKAVVLNRELASATQLLNEQLEHARDLTTCAAVAMLDGPVATPSDPAFDVVRSVSDAANPADADPCPDAYPGVVQLEVQVMRDGEAEVLTHAVTLILVKSAS